MSEPRRVIAFERRGLVLIGAVDVEGDPHRVIAEGGGVVHVPRENVLRTFSARVAGGTTKEIGQDLRRRRLECEERVDLELLWESVSEGDVLSLDDLLAVWAGEPTDEATLALIRSLEGALPWFTPVPGGLRRNPPDAVDQERRRRESEQRAQELEAAVIEWLSSGSSAPPPEDSERVIEELRQLARHGTDGASKRAIRVSRKIGCPEADDVLEKLEEVGLLPLHLDVSPARWGVRVDFPEGLAATADLATAEAAGDREDLTDLATIALDDPDTVEVDDALSYEERPDGILLHVHIADVAAGIERDSPLDLEAARRRRTVYEPDRRIPMFPGEVVPALSLDEGVVRPAVTGTFRITPDGEVLESRFRPTLVRVDRRSGYEGSGPDLLGPMAGIAEALRRRREAEGAVCLDLPDSKLVVVDGEPHVKIRHPITPGDLVVSEAAVLYNRSVADVLAAAGASGMFRSQAALESRLPDREDPLRILKARRMLPRAESAIEPVRHHGVAADRYLTATSPIRRYADLLHQRQLLAVLAGAPPAYGPEEMRAMIESTGEAERAARMVEGERFSYWLGRLLETRVGGELSAIVSRTMPAGRVGVWVEEFLREFTLRVPRGHPPLAEGDPLRVRVVKVRPRRGSVHLEVAAS